MNRLQALGLTVPVIQAPMAGVSTPELAKAVSLAGGLGSISAGASSAAEARAMMESLRSLSPKPYNLNVFVHKTPEHDSSRNAAWLACLRPHFEALGGVPPLELSSPYLSLADHPDLIRVILEIKPPVLSFHFGLPEPELLRTLKQDPCRQLIS